MPGAPPLEYWSRLPPADLIKAASDGMNVAISRGVFEHVLARTTDNLTDADFRRLKMQLDASATLVAMMIRKRVDFGLTTGPVEETK